MIFRKILDWSEVWALLIPLFVLIWKGNKKKFLRPVVVYVFSAFFLNLAANIIYEFKIKWNLPAELRSNNFIYNIHAIVRFFLLSWFFISLDQPLLKRVKKIIPYLFSIIMIVNFTFYENFFNYRLLSSLLFATSAGFLLFYCLQYFISILQDEKIEGVRKEPGFWFVTGLTLYVAVNFFIFLFYTTLILKNEDFAIIIWDVHNYVFIIFCICTAMTFYERNNKRI